jgi:hypothetical protein
MGKKCRQYAREFDALQLVGERRPVAEVARAIAAASCEASWGCGIQRDTTFIASDPCVSEGFRPAVVGSSPVRPGTSN